MKILVTGSNGQLGSELQDLAPLYAQWQFTFTNRTQLDITNVDEVQAHFKKNSYDFIINAAAYTAVDKAETDTEGAYAGNALAPKYLAEVAVLYGIKLIHVSTDYVFDGTKTTPYTEADAVNPINYYGESKLAGEQFVQSIDRNAIIIRTSWVYSFYGHNFVKTMLRLMNDRTELNVVGDQVGSPTYALGLAETICEIIKQINEGNNASGIFNFSNIGEISWATFAKAIAAQANKNCVVYAIPSTAYPTPAKRSPYSLLDKSKIEKTFNLTIPTWEAELKRCLSKLGEL